MAAQILRFILCGETPDNAWRKQVIQAALELHDKVSRTFRKTAANFHYEFSIRHWANVFKGLLMSDPSFFPTPDKFAALFIHEAERVYGDRLVSPAHLTDYMKIAKDTGKKFFKDLNQNEVFPSPHIFCNCWKDLDEKVSRPRTCMSLLSLSVIDLLLVYLFICVLHVLPFLSVLSILLDLLCHLSNRATIESSPWRS